MPRLYSCPNGHRWEDTFGDFDSISADQTITCPVCGTQVKVELPKQPSTVRSASPEPPPSATLALHHVPPISAPPPEKPSIIAGHEILGELGRGGMGVVYKARNQKLNRTVALKMLLAGAHANNASLARFRAEAEAVARLQHPNIVQIYETGEADGNPFFSMEFVAGKSLVNHIAGNPQPARDSAQLVATLARAMQAAHHAGIIHRDLKPANILLSREQKVESGEPNAGLRLSTLDSPLSAIPKITDFGLAKRLDDVAGQTRTGEVMGTPSYMAPEQATGRVKEIGPATDVYALGAILYEMLTGRPPFKAETAVDTMLQVLQVDPVAPSRLRTQTPRDLETICLKCLAKEPNKRYPSAQALAEDLEKFLEGRPIAARPAGLLERGIKWVRRRPAVAGLLATIMIADLSVAGVIVWKNLALQQMNSRLEAVVASEKKQAEEAARQRDEAIDARKQANEQEVLAKEQGRQAQENFQRARRAVREMLAEVGREDLKQIPLMEGVRQKLLARALEFQREFLAHKSDEPALRQQAAQANVQVGEIDHLLGRHGEAEKAYREATNIYAKLTEGFPQRADYQQERAQTYFQLGRLLRDAGRMPAAEEAFRTAQRLQESLVAAFQDEPEYRRDLAHTQNDLARLLHLMNRPGPARQAYRNAMNLQRGLVEKYPDSRPEYREDLAGSIIDLGAFLRAVKEPEAAGKAYAEALKLLHPLADPPDAAPEYRQKLAATYNNLGNLQCESYLGNKAEESLKQALKYRLRLRNEFPSYLTYRLELAQTYNNLAALLAKDPKRQEEAERTYAEAAKDLRELVSIFPTVPDLRNSLASVLDNQAAALLKQKQVTRARELLREAADHHDKAGREVTAYRPFFRTHYEVLADALLTPAPNGETPPYAEAAKAATELARRFADDRDANLKSAVAFARCRNLAAADSRLSEKQRQDQVAAYANQALAMLQKAVDLGYRDVAQLKAARVFVPLHGREEFKKLLKEMEKPPQ